MYAKRGEISLSVVANGDQQGVVIVARDQGPGIPDVSRALQDGYSTSGGLGLGLPGARRLMDDFDIASVVRSEEHTSELQSPCNLVCRLLLEKKKSHSPRHLRCRWYHHTP